MGAPVRVGASVRSALHPRPRLVVHLPCEGRCAHLVAVQLVVTVEDTRALRESYAFFSERVRRIELPSLAWEARALPLSYTRLASFVDTTSPQG